MQRPYMSDIIDAEDVLQRFFRAHGVYTAVIGGLAMQHRASTRNTGDVDMAVEGPYDRIISLLRSEPRFKFQMFEEGAVIHMSVYIQGRRGCSPMYVPADIVIGGTLHIPNIPHGTEVIRSELTGRDVRVLDLENQVKTKLQAWSTRRKDHDFQDLVTLGKLYPRRISRMRHKLDQTQRNMFLNDVLRMRPDVYGLLRRVY